MNSMRYLQMCEGYRPDLSIVDMEMLTYDWFLRHHRSQFPQVVFPGAFYHLGGNGTFSMKDFLDVNFDHVPIFVCVEWKQGDDSMIGSYDLVPLGILGRVRRLGKNDDWFEFSSWRERSANLLPLAYDMLSVERLKTYSVETWENQILQDLVTAKHRRAEYEIVYMLKHWEEFWSSPQDRELLVSSVTEATQQFEEYFVECPLGDENKMFVQKNIGIGYKTLWEYHRRARNPSTKNADLERVLSRAVGAFEKYLNAPVPFADQSVVLNVTLGLKTTLSEVQKGIFHF